jgi:hypothetical protein
MSSIATFECFKNAWVAEQVYGENPRHTDMAVAALDKRTPFCRRHLLGRDKKQNHFLKEFDRLLLNNDFDLSSEFDTIIIKHDTSIDPVDELDELQKIGHELLELVDEVPDFAYLDGITVRGASSSLDRTYLTPSEIHDLEIARRSLTNMLLTRHHD